MCADHQAMFREGLGKLKEHPAKSYVDPGAKPHFCKARLVPYVLRNKVKEELKCLQKESIIEPV